MTENTAPAAPIVRDYLGAGRRAVMVLVEVCSNDLDAVERIITQTEAAMVDRREGSKYILAMRAALRQVRLAQYNVKGLYEVSGGNVVHVRRVITDDEAMAKQGGYLSPKRAFYHQAQRWALDLLEG